MRLIKVAINSLQYILDLLGFPNTIRISSISPWKHFHKWYISLGHTYLKFWKLLNDLPGYFNCLVLLFSWWISYLAIVNADQVALLNTWIRLYDEGSTTISPSCVATVRNSLTTNFKLLAILFNLWITRATFVHLEHPSHYFLVAVECNYK